MDCPDCGNETGEWAAFCTRCGVALPKQRSAAKKIFKWSLSHKSGLALSMGQVYV